MHDLTAIANKEHFTVFLLIPVKHKIDYKKKYFKVLSSFCLAFMYTMKLIWGFVHVHLLMVNSDAAIVSNGV